MTAALEPNVVAVVADSPYRDIPSLIGGAFEHFIGLPAFPFGPVTVKIAELRADIDVGRISPLNDVTKLNGRPLLIIHGLETISSITPTESTSFAMRRSRKACGLCRGRAIPRRWRSNRRSSSGALSASSMPPSKPSTIPADPAAGWSPAMICGARSGWYAAKPRP